MIFLTISDVGSSSHERKSNRVDAVLKPNSRSLRSFIGQRGDGERNPGEIDALVLAQHATVDHVAQHVFAANGAHAQFDQAIAQQDAGTG